ncbi:hypothetical protein [Lactobacillus sp.]|uniref:hypothetical protein n=1 Tax=Lactobacillus sp. TaxID=1591 RepID=UPI001984232F|nr:hypothetical protein [Lactobacillus sp.]MBD5430694.1 hypothetical protein [Lactobacillus sp.]
MHSFLKKLATTVGIIFIVLAVLILIDALNILPGPWGQHLGLTFFFLVIFIFLIRWRLTFLATLFLSFIIMLHKTGMGMTHVSNWTILGIAILIGIGLSLLYHPYVRYIQRLIKGEEPVPFSTLQERDDDADAITIYSRLSDTSRTISGEFEKIKINAKLSNLDLHMDQALLATPTGKINIKAESSDLILYIPLEWKIDTDKLHKISSTINFNGPENGTTSKVLYIDGDLIKSTLTITRV